MGFGIGAVYSVVWVNSLRRSVVLALIFPILSFATEQSDKNFSTNSTLKTLAAKAEELQKQLDLLKHQMAEITAPASSAPSSSSPINSFTTEKHPEQTQKTLAAQSLPLRKTPEVSPAVTPIPAIQSPALSILGSLDNVTVVSSPYLGKAPAFNGSDLIVNMSMTNLDLNLMEQRQAIENLYIQDHAAPFDTPLVMLSGLIQPIGLGSVNSQGHTQGETGIYSTMFDVAAVANPWVEGFLSFSGGASAYALLVRPNDFSNNSTLDITFDNAFVNIGNLNATPFYFTAGQAYMPFGQYLSNMVTWSMISAMGQTRMPTAMLSYSHGNQNGFSGTLFTYKSNNTAGNSGAGGGNLIYQFGNDSINGNITGSLISNLADSGGMQNTGNDVGFLGFGQNASTEATGQIPAYDFNGILNFGPYNILAEYVSAFKPFDSSVLSYNGSGSQPSGGNIEAARTFKWLNKPATFAIGYGWTSQSVALYLARQRLSTTFNISWWRDTIESLELRHDIDYGSTDSGTGLGATSLNTGTGTSNNTLTASLAVYF